MNPDLLSPIEHGIFLRTRVETIGLDTTISRGFLKAGIRTVGGILNLTPERIREIYGAKADQVNESVQTQLEALAARVHQSELNVREIPPMLLTPVVQQQSRRGASTLGNLPRDLSEEADIVGTMATALGYSVADIIGPTRKQGIVLGRDLIVYLLRRYADMSYPAIGRLLGGRDHTTIIHAHRKMERQAGSFLERFETDPKMLDLLKSLNEVRARKLAVAEELRLIAQSLRQQDAPLPERRRLAPFVRKISERNSRVLELYREGLTYQNIGSLFKLTRERVRQIVVKTIQQTAINESITKGIVMDVAVMTEEERKKRRAAKYALKPQLPQKTDKEKRWSLYYSACKGCGTTSIKHLRRGLCQICGGQVRGKLREDMISQHGGVCDVCGITRGDAIREKGRDFYITKDKKVLCKKCFLSVQGQKLGSRIRRAR